MLLGKSVDLAAYSIGAMASPKGKNGPIQVAWLAHFPQLHMTGRPETFRGGGRGAVQIGLSGRAAANPEGTGRHPCLPGTPTQRFLSQHGASAGLLLPSRAMSG